MQPDLPHLTSSPFHATPHPHTLIEGGGGATACLTLPQLAPPQVRQVWQCRKCRSHGMSRKTGGSIRGMGVFRVFASGVPQPHRGSRAEFFARAKKRKSIDE